VHLEPEINFFIFGSDAAAKSATENQASRQNVSQVTRSKIVYFDFLAGAKFS
jgi:hypothetical protein